MAKRVHRIDRVLRKALKGMDLGSKLEGYRIWGLWGDIVGDQVARRTQPERIKNRILFVRVSSSAWMHQLQTMKPLLMERIRKITKGEPIRDIRFLLGEISPPVADDSESTVEDELSEVELSGEMESCLTQIEDGELKSLFRSIMEKQAKRTKE
jgi:hypothetical protein